MLKFERHNEKLLNTRAYLYRQLRFTLVAVAYLAFSLAIGMAGYHYLEALSWLDSYLNAAMIMGGMGPVDVLHTAAGKFFAGTYALYSGLGLLVSVGIMAAPLMHRIFHYFHLEVSDND